MSYSDPRHRHDQRLTQWLAAIRQHAAWLYAADEGYSEKVVDGVMGVLSVLNLGVVLIRALNRNG
ncbi:hypothetical protein IPC245_12645 [Pseudomonas aeruginosa]|nr:hypothetical protein IPC253_08235 [Pseudomonas aeruginosa]RUK29243.1 hypothetical protein IPC245_12645 [Pseudomonas aeruginosa]